MTTDNRTTNPSTEQIEAEAREHFPELDPKYASLTYPAEAMRSHNRSAFESGARWAALVAAAGAAPQAAKDVHEPSHDRVYCVRCGGNWPCQPAPVQPSSTVDEWQCGFCNHAYPNGDPSGDKYPKCVICGNEDDWEIRAVVEAIGGESR